MKFYNMTKANSSTVGLFELSRDDFFVDICMFYCNAYYIRVLRQSSMHKSMDFVNSLTYDLYDLADT